MGLTVNIRKKLGSFRLDINFTADKSRLGILGGSGCGKSVTLKCIAGIITPDEGRIVLNGRVLFDSEKKINIRPQKRRVGYLFQDYALFPTYTAYQNIGGGLDKPAAEKKAIVDGLVRRFHLEGLEDQYPHQLSGGQQQRTALARIVACEPELILLDEPFSALDSHLKEKMHIEMSEILKAYENSILVTHSRDEVYKLCTDTMVMNYGRVAIIEKTRELFKSPRYKSVARLTGCKNISRAVKRGENELEALDWGGAILQTAVPVKDNISFVGVRAHEWEPIAEKLPGRTNIIRLDIVNKIEAPFEQQIIFRNADGEGLSSQSEIWWEFSKSSDSEVTPFVRISPEKLLLLEADNID